MQTYQISKVKINKCPPCLCNSESIYTHLSFPMDQFKILIPKKKRLELYITLVEHNLCLEFWT